LAGGAGSSANGVRALLALSLVDGLVDVPLLGVGESSAKAAREAGFANVHSANGDLSALISLAKSSLSPSAGPLLYLSGTIVSGDLKGSLEAEGFEVHRGEIYEAKAVNALPEAAHTALIDETADGVGLFSRRSAKIWVSLVQKMGLTAQVANLAHICLSEPVAAELKQSWPLDQAIPPIIIATDMNLDGFLDSLAKVV